MTSRRDHELVLAIYPQSSGVAFILFKGWGTPIDFGAFEARGREKNARCLKRVESLLALHSPDALVLQQMSRSDNRAPRIQQLNRDIAELGKGYGIALHRYRLTELRESFAYHFDATTKQRIAETIAQQITALSLYLPPERKPWKSEHVRMGIFEAAALAWMYFHHDHRGSKTD
jgi:hypothetical protein